jgi:primosomal protein N' (replication factor Y)
VSLAFHQGARELRCHYCDYHTASPDTCPSCHSLNIKPIGAGTERLEETLKGHFPAARIGRLDSDTITTQHNRTQVLQDMHDRNLDILVGTQMIAKGHDFSHVTLVGVIAAETGLNVPDFRAAERSFQLLMQASGRAGRAHLEGEVLIQTLQPEHACLTHLVTHNYTAFAEDELQHREGLQYPPYGRLISCTIASNSEKNGLDYASSLASFLGKHIGDQKISATLLGPAPALMYKLRGKTRM